MEWPDFYPEGCPPLDAKTDPLTVFRLVSNDPPIFDDFLAHCEEQRRRKLNIPVGHPNKKQSNITCDKCGTSVMLKKEDAENLRSLVAGQRDKLIAKGQIDGNVGQHKTHPTRNYPSHQEWWVPSGCDPSPRFAVI